MTLKAKKTSKQATIAITYPGWMLAPLEADRLDEMIHMVHDEKRRNKLSKAAVVGGTATSISVGVLGHMYVTNSSANAADMENLTESWFNDLSPELQNLIRCTVIVPIK